MGQKSGPDKPPAEEVVKAIRRATRRLVSNDGWLGDAALLYANGHDLKDPMLSPVYNALGDAAMDLSLDDHRVDQTAGAPLQ